LVVTGSKCRSKNYKPPHWYFPIAAPDLLVIDIDKWAALFGSGVSLVSATPIASLRIEVGWGSPAILLGSG
jgi:hypothetical protein